MFFLVGLTLSVILAYFLCKWIQGAFKRPESSQFIPGPPDLPIVGSIPFLPRYLRPRGQGLHVPKVFHYVAKTYGPVAKISLGPVKAVVISDGYLLKEAFKLDTLTSRPPMRPFNEFRYGGNDGCQRGVILSSGHEWQEQRRFCLKTLRDFGFGKSTEGMENSITIEVDKLLEVLARHEGPIDLNHRMNISIVNALWYIMVGERLELSDARLDEIVKALDDVIRSAKVTSIFAILFPTLFKHLHPRFANAKAAFDKARKVMRKAVDDHWRMLNPKQGPNKKSEADSEDFIDSYLHEILQCSDEKSSFHGEMGLNSLECVLIDVFIGGSETTATSLVWAILFLLHHPEVQTRAQEEIEQVCGPNCRPRLSHRSKLPYMNAVIHETMRISSIISGGVPHYATEDTEIPSTNFVIPKGSTVMPNLSFIHHDTTVWGNDAELFKPDRFIHQDTGAFRNPNPDSFVPFSVGKRACIGKTLGEQEMFLFLSGLLFKFRNDKIIENHTSLQFYLIFKRVINFSAFKHFSD